MPYTLPNPQYLSAFEAEQAFFDDDILFLKNKEVPWSSKSRACCTCVVQGMLFGEFNVIVRWVYAAVLRIMIEALLVSLLIMVIPTWSARLQEGKPSPFSLGVAPQENHRKGDESAGAHISVAFSLTFFVIVTVASFHVLLCFV
jgi:hypothetical protein